MSSRGMSASSMITATATFGSSSGANEVNHANGLRFGSDWAVPVLPPTSTPLIWAFLPVPLRTTTAIICCSSAACSGVIGLESTLGLRVSSGFRSGACTMLTRYGSISTPSLAIAADTIAICSGLAATSNCPIELRASCALSSLSGNRLAAPPTSGRCRRSKPNSAACSRSLS
jgi:hypothetical protein